MHEPGPDVGFEYQREVVAKDLLVSSPGSLHHDGVDAEKLRWMLMASRPSLVTPSGRFEMQCSGSFPLAKIPRIDFP